MTGGERWASEQLDALRAGRFAPRAWNRFLSASFRRAADTRRAREQLVRQARTWSLVGAFAGIAACIAAPRVEVAAPRPQRFALWWLATALMLDWHLGMVEGPDGERRERLSAADALTLLRLWTVPFLAVQGDLPRRSRRLFSGLIAAAGAADTLDGIVARRVGTSRLGRDLDKIADASILAAAARAGRRAGWLTASVAYISSLRATLPIAAVAATYFRSGTRPPIDSAGVTRRLAPLLLGGLAVAPMSPSTGGAAATTAAVASLVLDMSRLRLPPRD